MGFRPETRAGVAKLAPQVERLAGYAAPAGITKLSTGSYEGNLELGIRLGLLTNRDIL